MSEEPLKVVVIGLDGATFKLIDPLVSKGKLPGIDKLIKEGCRGVMKSCIPVSSIPAWQCYSTGRDPSKLGVYGFFKIKVDRTKREVKVRPVSSYDFQGKEIWDYLGKNGFRSCVIDMPGTYPARKINGIMISNPFLEGSVYPPEMEKILKKLEYRDPDLSKENTDFDKFLDELKLAIQSRFDLAEYIINRNGRKTIDFLHLTIFYIEVAHHKAWGNSKIMLEFYKLIDENIKKIVELIESINDNSTVIIMSDHGHTKLKDIFYTNEYFIEKGYLKSKTARISNVMYKFGLTIDKLDPFVKRISLLRIAKKFVPSSLRDRIPNKDGLIPGPREFIDKTNFDESKLFSPDGFTVYSLEEDEEFISHVIEELENLKHPTTHEYVIEKVYRKNEIFSSPDENAPDLVIHTTDGYWASREIRSENRIWSYTKTKWHGTHAREGIFIAYGKNIKNTSLDLNIYDIAPTILHIFGLAIPKDVNGRVLREIFSENSEYAKRKPMYCDYEKVIVREKVKELKIKGKI